MSHETDSEFELLKLRLRVSHLERILIGLFGVVLGGLMILNTIAVSLIGKAGMVFGDMLGGHPLPPLSQMIVGYGESGMAGLVSTLVPLGAFIFLVAKRSGRASWYLAVVIIALLVLHWCIVVAALWMPFVPMVGLHDSI